MNSLISQINTARPIILIGISMGGMICCELESVLNPIKTIIISSAKCSNKFPFRYTFQQYIPIYKLFPKRILYWGHY